MDDEEPRSPSWEGRELDRRRERRIDRLALKLDKIDSKLDALTVRVAIGAGILGVVTFLANVFGPIIAARIMGP